MVAQREHVEADFVHHGSIGLTGEQRVEQRPGDGVAGMDLRHVGVRPEVVDDLVVGLHHTRESTHLDLELLVTDEDVDVVGFQV